MKGILTDLWFAWEAMGLYHKHWQRAYGRAEGGTDSSNSLRSLHPSTRKQSERRKQTQKAAETFLAPWEKPGLTKNTTKITGDIDSIFSSNFILLLLPLMLLEISHNLQQGLSSSEIPSYCCVIWVPVESGNHGKNKNSSSHCLLHTYYVLYIILAGHTICLSQK